MYPDAYERATKAKIRANANKTFLRVNSPERVHNILKFLIIENNSNNPFELWVSLFTAYEKYGKLTEGQMVCVERAIAKRACLKEERQKEYDSKKALSNFIGEIKEKITIEVTVDAVTSYDRPQYHYNDRGYTMVYLMSDANGNRVVYKSTTSHACLNDKQLEKGYKVKVTATVKEHKEYNNEKQTLITRPKWANL